MQGRDFLKLAQEIVIGAEEYHWRGAAIHAYYALVLECRDALQSWGVTIPRHQNVHAFVRLKLVYAQDADLKAIALALDWLVQRRNGASYDLQSPWFANNSTAQQAIHKAETALALLDGIDADPARRAAAIAALPP
jgi:hypothetical protein